MANIEIANLKLIKSEHVNISDVVGVGGQNKRNDVLLIQALFKLVGFSDFFAKKFFGLTEKDLPTVTGNLDTKTIQAICGFQRCNALRLLNIDGKIHPAGYKDRVIKKAFTGRVMAMTFLNIYAIDGALMSGADDVKQAVKNLAPSIIFV